MRFTTDHDRAKEDNDLTLMGIEHPLARLLMQNQRDFPAGRRSVVGRVLGEKGLRGALSIWHVQIYGGKGPYQQRIVTIG